MAEWGSFGKALAADGIKARAARKGFAHEWWARRWITLLESFGWTSRLARGRNYARKGQVLDLEIESGRVTAQVQGSRPRPYDVSIEIGPLSDKAWRQATEEMRQQALFSATLLAGRMPDSIEEAFPAKEPLLPASARQLKLSCSCPDFASPCKHLAAVFYLLAEAFDQDPFLLFVLRGRRREDVLGHLEEASPAPPPQTLGLDMSRFWTDPPDCPPFPPPPHVECSLLRRLGPPGSWSDEEELLQAYLPIYRRLRGEEGRNSRP